MYLRKAGEGEDVVITSRGQPVARLLALAPAAGPEPAASELEQRVKLIPGLLPAKGGKPLGSERPMAIRRGRKTLAELVIEDRKRSSTWTHPLS